MLAAPAGQCAQVGDGAAQNVAPEVGQAGAVVTHVVWVPGRIVACSIAMHGLLWKSEFHSLYKNTGGVAVWRVVIPLTGVFCCGT